MDYFYRRYLANNKKLIWKELLSLTQDEIKKNQESIRLILDYFIEGLKQNIEVIDFFLKDSEYVFTKIKESGDGITIRDSYKEFSYGFHSPSESKEMISNLKQSTISFGILPLIFVKLYESVKYVTFEGYFPEWKYGNYLKSLPVLDALVLMPLDVLPLIFELNDKEFLKEDGKHYIGFSPTPYTKEDVSDDGLLGIFLYEKERLDGRLAGYGRNLLFSDYLRNCFEWGGFPGLAFADDIPKDDPNMMLIKRISKEMIPI